MLLISGIYLKAQNPIQTASFVANPAPLTYGPILAPKIFSLLVQLKTLVNSLLWWKAQNTLQILQTIY